MTIKMRTLNLITTATLTGLAYSALLMAPEAHAADSASAPRLQEIIVTAEKRPEQLQKVPAAITVISAHALERNRISSIQGVAHLAPSLTWQQGLTADNSSIYIRGFGTSAFGEGVESSVAVILDGVPLSQQNEAFGNLFNLKRIEILRGPQGTLFGTDASAGVVRIVTAPPTKKFQGKADIYYGSYNDVVGRATVSGPLTSSGRVTGRLTGFFKRVDGNILNKYNGKKLNGIPDSFGFRGKLAIDITRKLHFLMIGDFSKMITTCCAETIRTLPPNTNVFGIPVFNVNTAVAGVKIGPNSQQTSLDAPTFDDTKNYGFSGQFDYDLGWADFKSISAYREWLEDHNSDIDFSPLPLFLRNGGLNGQRTFTQEFRLTSISGTPFQWVTGVFYSNNRYSQDFFRSLIGGHTQNLFSHLWRKEYAAYGQVNYRFSTGTHLIAGARAQEDKLRYSADVTKTHFNTLDYPSIPTSFSHNHEMFKFGVQQELSHSTQVYFTFSQGYKGQAIDLTTGLSAAKALLQPIAPETVNSYEVGFKGDFFNHRLRFDADAFLENFKNFQAQAYDQAALTFRLVNAGKVRSKGIEIESAFAATRDLRFTANATFLDTRILRMIGTGCYPGQTVAEGCVNRVQNLTGSRLPNAPKTKLFVGAHYRSRIGQGPYVGFANLNYSWQSSVQFSLNQDPYTVEGSYGISNLSFGAENADTGLKVSLYVDNLFNRHYATFIRDVGGIWGTSTGTTQEIPRQTERTYGARIGISF